MSYVCCDVASPLLFVEFPGVEVCVEALVGDVFFVVEGADVGGDEGSSECPRRLAVSARGMPERSQVVAAAWRQS
jgi:hypothetical protein